MKLNEWLRLIAGLFVLLAIVLGAPSIPIGTIWPCLWR